MVWVKVNYKISELEPDEAKDLFNQYHGEVPFVEHYHKDYKGMLKKKNRYTL